jgi:predicted metal-dependent hydrolase
MLETLVFSIVIIFIIVFITVRKKKANSIYVNSKNGLKFLVYKDEFINEKSILLGDIVNNMLILKQHLVTNKKDFPEYIEYIELLDKNFTEKRTNIYETEPGSNLTSYSVNKGEELSVCLKSKTDNKLHDINLLMYVVIHEMAHMGCPEIGHGDLFKKVFKFFAEESVKIGIYKYVNYNKYPVEYCGMNLQSTIL